MACVIEGTVLGADDFRILGNLEVLAADQLEFPRGRSSSFQ